MTTEQGSCWISCSSSCHGIISQKDRFDAFSQQHECLNIFNGLLIKLMVALSNVDSFTINFLVFLTFTTKPDWHSYQNKTAIVLLHSPTTHFGQRWCTFLNIFVRIFHFWQENDHLEPILQEWCYKLAQTWP